MFKFLKKRLKTARKLDKIKINDQKLQLIGVFFGFIAFSCGIALYSLRIMLIVCGIAIMIIFWPKKVKP